MHPETSHRLKTGCSFASIVWNPYLVKDRKVQKFACRVCSKNWHTDYQCRLLDGLRIPSLELRRAMRLCFMYKLIDNNTHIVILPISQRNCPYYTTRSTSSKQLYHAIPHNSYFPQTITDWNNLPASMVSCHNIVSFKCQLAIATSLCSSYNNISYVLLFLRVYMKY